jgi:hypothetical protein
MPRKAWRSIGPLEKPGKLVAIALCRDNKTLARTGVMRLPAAWNGAWRESSVHFVK